MQENANNAPQQAPAPTEATAQPTDFLSTYGSHIVIGILLVASVGVLAYRFLGSGVAEKDVAAAKLFSSRNPQDLEATIKQYPSAPITPWAIMKLAKIQFNSGNYDGALARYNDFIAKYPKHELTPAAELGRIECLEARNATDEALKDYTAFAAANTGTFLYPEAVFGRVRCLEQLGRHKEAIAACEDYIAAHPKSPWTSKAEDVVASLKKKVEEKKPSG